MGSEVCELILTQFCSSKFVLVIKVDLFKFVYLFKIVDDN